MLMKSKMCFLKVETTHPVKKVLAQSLLNQVLKRLKENRENNAKICLRIGFTGPPGAGKSSLIESFGKYATTKLGARIAVLTVDPSSSTTGGGVIFHK
jgi:LAO/AO transport system kinase